jgi:Rieske Fe-S protein
MELNRREFVIAAAAAACGCQGQGSEPGEAVTIQPAVVDAGPVADFQSPGIYDAQKNRGFFVVSKGESLSVVSSMCTHRNCRLKLAADHTSFVCKCHGSTFDASGHVTQGPALRDLPHFEYAVDDQKRLSVHVGTPAR